MLIQKEPTLAIAASKAGMDEKTARKYRRLGKLPSEVKKPHTWRTRDDPFADVWDDIVKKLDVNPGLQAKTLFEDLKRRYPGRYKKGQLRTLQRKIKQWRALEGPPKEIFFTQDYVPGERCQSDFTYMNSLEVTIQGELFDHLIYHFVLPYSNWETGTICFSESFESLSEGLQNALYELGGVPNGRVHVQMHQSDSMSSAVRKMQPGEDASKREHFTRRYKSLLSYYGLDGQHTQVNAPNENGDVEQRHHRFKVALEQALLMRGSRDFVSREEYGTFLDHLFIELNRGRRPMLLEEIGRLRRLPEKRLEAYTRLEASVGPGSTIRVRKNVYSVHSRLRGERVTIRLYADYIEVWYAQRCIQRMPRLRGEGKHAINYRHVIDMLVRKPGAFPHYRYRSDLFPTHRFRMAFDYLERKHQSERAASKAYLKILHLAATEQEVAVDQILAHLIEKGEEITPDAVKALIEHVPADSFQKIEIEPVNLDEYDYLLSGDGLSTEVDLEVQP